VKDNNNALSMPIYNSVAYEFETAEQMELAFTGKSPEHVYSRISNPTVQYFEQRVKALTNAAEVISFNSGMAAIANTIIAVAYAGSNIVTSPHLFGNTYSFLAYTLKDFGVEVRFCDLTKPDEVQSCIDKNTCALFLEVITNPQMEVADLKTLSDICKSHGVPLIADTTVIPFTVFNAAKFGVDIEIVSSTKYISGGATSLGGLVIDYGLFDWQNSSKLRHLINRNKLSAFSFKMRMEIHRNLGACMTPQVAYMQTIGLETLAVRYERSVKTCKNIAERMQKLNNVVSVNYPSLTNHPYYEISKQQFGEYSGAMFTFDLASRQAAFRFIDNLKLICRATNLFDNKTLAIHPASTIFGTFTEEIRKSMDISQNTIRISVGLESIDDLYNDMVQAIG
ncbi:MAG: aminotransferase class I/II-fold pyridoxal phosphate-dependent enzyme, partial [Prevotellaceae bacterium]|nr:aminotransferase class I/II-fold pyridoxal phosphate-dependent enzyme [Prevotellaceae bacterium]